MPGGSSITSFRFCGRPQAYPTTVADRVAGRVVSHLDKSPELTRQFLTLSGFLQLLPARLGENAALRDCVALFTAAWANFQRGLPVSELTDPKQYGRTVRSLQRALDNRQNFTCETLAAVTVMERFERMFDPARPLQWSSHRSGIITLMTARGPPKFDDEMEVVLALDNYMILVCGVSIFFF